MVFSLLHLVVTIRALLRSSSERFRFGVFGGVARAALMLVGAVLLFEEGALVMLPHLGTHAVAGRGLSPAGALALTCVSVVGPPLTLAVLWGAYRRFRDVPAAEEERLQRPFRAWLPVAILDASYVVIAIGARVMMSDL